MGDTTDDGERKKSGLSFSKLEAEAEAVEPIAYIKFIVKYPFAMCGIVFTVAMLLTIISMAVLLGDIADGVDFPAREGGESVRGDSRTENDDLLRLARQTQNENKIEWHEFEDQQSVARWWLYIMFVVHDDNLQEGNLFTREHLLSMNDLAKSLNDITGKGGDDELHSFEDFCLLKDADVGDRVIAGTNKTCSPPLSILNNFFPERDVSFVYPAAPVLPVPCVVGGTSYAACPHPQYITANLSHVAIDPIRGFYENNLGYFCDDAVINPSYPGIEFSGCEIPNGKGELIDEADFEEKLKLFNEAQYTQFFLDKEFKAPDYISTTTFYFMQFGSPLKGFDNSTSKDYATTKDPKGIIDLQAEIYEDWAISSFTDILDTFNEKHAEKYEALYFDTALLFQVFTDILIHDGLWGFGSLTFVFCYITFHTRSFFLAAVGMTHVLWSFPIAFFLYRVLFQIKAFYGLNFLAIFIILAIGADDIFVFIDAYKQSFLAGPKIAENLDVRMTWVFKRAAKAMLVTSVTSTVAFVATAVSPLTTVSTFGIFTASLVVINYSFVITWFPCMVVLYHKFNCNLCCCCCFGPKCQQKEIEAGMDDDPSKRMRRIEKFFQDKYAPFINHPKYKFAVLAGFICLFIIGVGGASQLEPNTQDEQFLPAWHPFQRIIALLGTAFRDNVNATMVTSTFVWGMDFLDRDGTSRYNVEEIGKIVFTKDFDLTRGDIQQHIFDTTELAFDSKKYPDMLRTALGDDEMFCPIRDFKQFQDEQGLSFPVEGSAFYSAFANFRNVTEGKDRESEGKYDDMVGYSGTTIIWIACAMNTQLEDRGGFGHPYLVVEPHYERWEAFKDDVNENGKDIKGGNKAIQTSRTWVRMVTQKTYVSSALTGMGASLIFSGLVLFLSTWNWILSIFATLTIMGIVATILGGMYYLGWTLGTIESVNATILVGLSVDYVVHLANSYMESKRNDRDERVVDALVEMGVTVIGGAVTSVGASLCLFLCWLQFFFKFGGFMCMTIVFSWAWSLGFFMACCAIAGPEGDTGSIKPYIDKLVQKIKEKK